MFGTKSGTATKVQLAHPQSAGRLRKVLSENIAMNRTKERGAPIVGPTHFAESPLQRLELTATYLPSKLLNGKARRKRIGPFFRGLKQRFIFLVSRHVASSTYLPSNRSALVIDAPSRFSDSTTNSAENARIRRVFSGIERRSARSLRAAIPALRARARFTAIRGLYYTPREIPSNRLPIGPTGP